MEYDIDTYTEDSSCNNDRDTVSSKKQKKVGDGSMNNSNENSISDNMSDKSRNMNMRYSDDVHNPNEEGCSNNSQSRSTMPSNSSSMQENMSTRSRGMQNQMPTGSSGMQSQMSTGSSGMQGQMPTGSGGMQSQMPTGSGGMQSQMSMGNSGMQNQMPTGNDGMQGQMSTGTYNMQGGMYGNTYNMQGGATDTSGNMSVDRNSILNSTPDSMQTSVSYVMPNNMQSGGVPNNLPNVRPGNMSNGTQQNMTASGQTIDSSLPAITTLGAPDARPPRNLPSPSEVRPLARNPFNNEAYQGSMQQILYDNIGQFVVVEFLIGTQNVGIKRGILYSVGRSYIVLYEENTDTYVICDIFSIKFVTFYQPNKRPMGYGNTPSTGINTTRTRR